VEVVRLKVEFEAPVVVEAEAEAEAEPVAEPDAEAEAEPEAEPVAEPVAEAETEAETEAEAEVEADAEADVVDEQTHPTSARLVIGGALHVACACHGATEVYGASPVTFSTLTRTGMTEPVLKLNLR
jgi:hypothetical protein